MRRRFFTLDVFTAEPLAGNPLAVVLDADGLSDARMQAIAKEFNLSETVFVRPPADPRHRAALRIFTPGRELPFAGHPTVGTAVLLAMLDAQAATGSVDAKLFGLEEKIGIVSCVAEMRGERRGYARFRLPRLPELIGEPPPNEAIAAALGLPVAAIGFDNHRPSVRSAGVGFTCIPVKGIDVIGVIKPDMAHWSAGIHPIDQPSAFVYCRETNQDGHHFHARMFSPAMGIPEDPATGSAAAAFAGVLMQFEKLGDGMHEFVIEQGFEMGRPSLIGLQITIEGGALVAAEIGGEAVLVSEGSLFA